MAFRVHIDEISCNGSYLLDGNRVQCAVSRERDEERPLYGGAGELEFTPIGDLVASFRLINLPLGWTAHSRGALCPNCTNRQNEEGFHVGWVG